MTPNCEIIIETLPLGPLPTNAFLLTQTQSKKSILIDAPPESLGTVASYLEKHGSRLESILITHGHWDHYADAQTIKNATKATVYAHPADKTWLEHPMMMLLYAPWGTKIKALEVDHWLENTCHIALLDQTIAIRHVPGHAPGNVLFYFEKLGSVFVGDALFAGSVGRYDLPGGDKDQLYQSIKSQIYTLPDTTIVYPGHGGPTTVGIEKTTNPYVRA